MIAAQRVEAALGDETIVTGNRHAWEARFDTQSMLQHLSTWCATFRECRTMINRHTKAESMDSFLKEDRLGTGLFARFQPRQPAVNMSLLLLSVSMAYHGDSTWRPDL